MAIKRYQDITDPALAKALAHPLRTRILTALEGRTASPSELADDLGVSLGVVSYHVRRLHALHFLRLVKRVPRRGAVEHYYTTVAGPRISRAAWASTPTIVKQAMVSATLSEIGGQASAAVQDGGFEPREAHLSRSPVTVDQEGWQALAAELDALLARIEQIEAESHKRLMDTDGEGGQRATVVLMLFRALGEAEPADARHHARRPSGSRSRAAAS